MFNHDTRPKLCIVAPYSYPLFNPACNDVFGGSEVRVSLIAKELAKRGSFDVSMLVWDHGQPHIECRDGVTLYSWLGQSSPLTEIPESKQGMAHKVLAVLKKNVSWKTFLAAQTLYFSCRNAGKELYKCLRDIATILKSGAGSIGDHVITRQDMAPFQEIDAAIYMMPGINNITAHLTFFCLNNNRRYVLLAGSDIDFDPQIKAPKAADMYGTSGFLKQYAIENAHLRIVQNQHQAQLLADTFGLQCTVVLNPLDITQAFTRSENPASILWVGKSDSTIKQPGIILELARYLPQYNFTIIMSRYDSYTHAHCLHVANALPNVKLLTYVPFNEIEKYFADARLFINTSVFEGFPNTFLQAAKYGVPIISLQVDPGGMVSKHLCGLTCGNSFTELVIHTQKLMSDDSRYEQISSNCLQYVREHHDKEMIITQIEEQLLATL